MFQDFFFPLQVGPKWLLFRNSCFEMFLLKTPANLTFSDVLSSSWYLAAWEASCQYARWEAAPRMSSSWESSAATPGFLNRASGRLSSLVLAMVWGLSWSQFWSQDSQSWKLVLDSEGTEVPSKVLGTPKHYQNKGKWVDSVIRSILECQLAFQGSSSSIGFFFMTFPHSKLVFFCKNTFLFFFWSVKTCSYFPCGKVVNTQTITVMLVLLARSGQLRILSLCRCIAVR